MAGRMPEGPTLVYDTDNYYMGGVLAERLRVEMGDEFAHFVAIGIARAVNDLVPLRREQGPDGIRNLARANDGNRVGERAAGSRDGQQDANK